MATTFQNIYEDVLKRGHLPTNEAIALPLVKNWINQRYRQVARARPWMWLKKQGVIALVAPYTTGTVTTNGTTTITGTGTSWTSAMVGRRFKADDFDEVYNISAVPGAAEITLDTPFQGDDGSGKSYSIVAVDYSLASDFDRFVDPHRSFSPYQLSPLDPSYLNLRRGYYAGTGTPTHYTLASDGAGGVKLRLYPAPDLARTLYYDYLQQITALSTDGDEPLIPENYRDILADGAYADLLNFKDDNRSALFEAQFAQRLAELAGDYALTDDVPRLRPANQYRSHYRTATRGRVDDPWGFDHGIRR